MPLIIDGHNLIGALPDMRLDDPHDEQRLLDRLRAYRARSGGRPLLVFFDSSGLWVPPTQGQQPAGLTAPGLEVRFAAPGQTADDAIVAFLQGCAQPGQYAVVTNDHGLAQRVRMAGGDVLRASDFAPRLSAARGAPPAERATAPNPRDPLFRDIYDGFAAADKQQARFSGAAETDAGVWVERIYGEDVEQAQMAARWLGQYGGPAALPALRDALTHNDVRVRAAALLALGDLGDRAALPDLCRRLAEDPASMARTAAAQSLARIGDNSVEKALRAADKDPKSKVRKAAQDALAQIQARRKAPAASS